MNEYRQVSVYHGFLSLSEDHIEDVPSDCLVSLEGAPWRPRPGEIISITDRTGCYFRGRVFRITAKVCEVRLFERAPKAVESPLDILLLQALPEKERMEWIIQKSTELGVNTIVPFYSKRSTTIEERERGQKKAHRWPIVAQRAAKQCRRGRAPVITPYTSLTHALSYGTESDLKIMLWEKARDKGINTLLDDNLRPFRVCLLVGPEGGFDDDEAELAQGAGFHLVGLGPRILRTETAAIGIVSIIQNRYGDLG